MERSQGIPYESAVCNTSDWTNNLSDWKVGGKDAESKIILPALAHGTVAARSAKHSVRSGY